jgi:hypothetical protein
MLFLVGEEEREEEGKKGWELAAVQDNRLRLGLGRRRPRAMTRIVPVKRQHGWS